ncbi:MAG: UDP-N-acetylglucosamine 2-epimerase (hydrolyzing) [Bacteroidales bacterium]|nr:UDP-N-acetylglucosamine 2-epimerase (hydrolyzing) [Bacteroidales bacterium]
MKKIAVLTSSRADYGIYLPLLRKLKNDSFFELKLIVFGTHFSHRHGYTITQIIKDGFDSIYPIESVILGDSQNAISTSLALTCLKFADFWRDHQDDFDVVFCLGDRYEMFAAVISAIPYNIQFAHLHGGETTLGAIDNVFRHSISLASKFHFVSCTEHGKRVSELIRSDSNIFNVGSLSLDNLTNSSFLTKEKFSKKFGLDLKNATILVTMHPETYYPERNSAFVDELADVLLDLVDYQVLITLPNADTNNDTIRNRFLRLPNESDNRIRCFENLGSQAYFSAMKYCAFLLGNTSSGIIEAASLGKWVINLGKRQDGRVQSQNILNVPFKKSKILKAIKTIESNTEYQGDNVYYKKDVSSLICSILKMS